MIINRITHEFPGFTLDVENLNLEKNKIIGLVGENGSGKTTLMTILAGIMKSNSSFDVPNYEREDVMFIPSYVGLYEIMTVYDFVDLVSQYSSKKPDVMVLLDKLGLTEKKDVQMTFLSEGMRKKLMLITLFTDEYKVIILDEPFNSIDMNYVHELKAQLRELRKRSTILISSHILDTLNDLCDEFIYIKDGKVVKQFVNTGTSVLESELFTFEMQTTEQ